MNWEQPIQYAALSDIGFRRQNNQDAYVVHLSNERERWEERGHLFVVADGMGGHAVGELASGMAVDTVPHTFEKLHDLEPAEALRRAIEAANAAIHQRGLLNRDFLRMGTTCTALLMCPHGVLIGHVGDSRAYRIRQMRIEQLTSDHSLVWELIRQQRVTPEEAEKLYPRNVITRSLGPEPQVQVDLEGPLDVQPGDTYVICSDGLTSHVSDSEIGMIAGELAPSEACRLLVHLANLRGGIDNTTVIVVRVVGQPDAAPSELQALPTTASPDWQLVTLVTGLATAFLIGLGLALTTPLVLIGVLLMAVSALAGLGWFLYRRRRADVEEVVTRSDLSTVVWKPYRLAPAHISAEFVQQLARIEAELHRAAQEEHWPIDWAQHEICGQRAEVALQNKQLSSALRDYARSLDLLMTGVHWQRKQLHQEARWGKTAPPTRTKPT
jgi:protein phosphatase